MGYPLRRTGRIVARARKDELLVLHPCNLIIHGVKLPAVVADGIDVLSPLGQLAGVQVCQIVGVFDGVPPGEIKIKGEGRG